MKPKGLAECVDVSTYETTLRAIRRFGGGEEGETSDRAGEHVGEQAGEQAGEHGGEQAGEHAGEQASE